MNQFERACYVCGRDRGFEFLRAAIEQCPVGTVLEDGTEVSEEDAPSVWTALAYECEEINRQFSPWEMVAHAINSHEESEGGWEAYGDGIHQGMEIALWLHGRGHSLPARYTCDIP